jgi:hypothetical protein
MENQELIEIINEFSNNLRKNCCSNILVPIVRNNNFEGRAHIKLYDKICDACHENDNYALYPIEIIVDLNSRINRGVGIKCNDCIEKGCDIEGCVLSLRINSREHTRFTKTNRNPDSADLQSVPISIGNFLLIKT